MFKFMVALFVFGVAACAHHDGQRIFSRTCEQMGKLEIQFLSPDDGSLGSKDQKYFLNDNEFIKTDSETIRRAFKRACENSGPEKSTDMLFLGRIVDRSTNVSLWITSKGKMSFENKKVNLPEAEVDELVKTVEAVLPND
ncbi:MAG: hypothetical protein J0L82_08600 [Deltaproteobacteria bacterium]|nr:hypothetical protein [Deltaproteobacteria bacterium]